MTLGEMTLGAPAIADLTEGDATGDGPWGAVPFTTIPISVAGPRWLRFRVSGVISVGLNPDVGGYICGDQYFSCVPVEAFRLNGQHVGPAGFQNQLQVAIRSSVAPVMLHSTDDSVPAVEGIYWVDRRESNFAVSRSGAYAAAIFNVPYYTFSGEQSVRADEIPQPVDITSEPASGAGTGLVFSARAVEPYTLSTPYDFGQITWYWVPGDTASDPNFDWGSLLLDRTSPLDQCTGAPTCAYTPMSAGRMYIHSRIFTGDGLPAAGPAYLFSGIIRPRGQEPKLLLACDSTSIHRGSDLHCTATVSNGGIASNYEWMFVDSATHQISGPKGPAEWGGTMATGGEMQVRATVSGVVQTATTEITVTPREWGDGPPLPLREIYQRCTAEELSDACPLFYPPRVIHELGEGRAEPHGNPVSDKARGTIINSGPNRGWAYITGTDPMFRYTEYLIHYHDLFTHPTDSWWQWQSNPYCHTVGGIQDLLRAVQTHERRHYRMFADIYGGAHDMKWNLQYEGFKRYGVENLETWQQVAIGEAARLGQQMAYLSGINHDYPNTRVWAVYALCTPDLPDHLPGEN